MNFCYFSMEGRKGWIVIFLQFENKGLNFVTKSATFTLRKTPFYSQCSKTKKTKNDQHTNLKINKVKHKQTSSNPEACCVINSYTPAPSRPRCLGVFRPLG